MSNAMNILRAGFRLTWGEYGESNERISLFSMQLRQKWKMFNMF